MPKFKRPKRGIMFVGPMRDDISIWLVTLRERPTVKFFEDNGRMMIDAPNWVLGRIRLIMWGFTRGVAHTQNTMRKQTIEDSVENESL